jgi:hypothetical protein
MIHGRHGLCVLGCDCTQAKSSRVHARRRTNAFEDDLGTSQEQHNERTKLDLQLGFTPSLSVPLLYSYTHFMIYSYSTKARNSRNAEEGHHRPDSMS